VPDGLRVRGFPLLQLLIIAAVFAAASIPVWSLTRPAPDAPVVAPAAPSATPAAASAQSLRIEASFAPAPTDFQIRCEDQTVLEGRGPKGQFSTQWKTGLPAEGIDLIVRASWPAETDVANAAPAAAHVVITLPNGDKLDKTFWTAPGQPLAEIVTVPGGPAAATPAP
jgi:hypothetical protein